MLLASWQPSIYTAYTGQDRVPPMQPLLVHKQAPHEHPQLVCSWMPLGLGWEELSHYQKAEATGQPVLAKFTASQGPFVLHHQPMQCRMLELLVQRRAWLPQTGLQSLDFPLLHPDHTREVGGSQARFCLMLPLIS